jgi:hypothetical protein
VLFDGLGLGSAFGRAAGTSTQGHTACHASGTAGTGAGIRRTCVPQPLLSPS